MAGATTQILTIFDLVGASLSQALPALTRRVTIWVDGIAAASMQVASGGTSFHLPLDEPYVLKGSDLSRRTLYFTTVSGEHIYIAAEHSPAI